ncbi:MAG: hypothetical protein ACREK8_05230 [Gemmatimonadales bacterium]
MCRRILLLVVGACTVLACSDHSVPTISSAAPATAAAALTGAPRAARERLAQLLAIALGDSSTRAAVKRRLDASTAPEGKLQFQTLVSEDQSAMLASLVRAGTTSAADLLAQLDAARGLELYLPVAAQRSAWNGDANFLVGTIGSDSETPVGFDSRGTRLRLDPRRPPSLAVLALVPQETDFSGNGASHMVSCGDSCGGSSGGGGGSIGHATNSAVPGLYLIQSHFTDYFESWLKGNPEFEFHVYGLGDNGTSVQLTCTGEHAVGPYQWNQDQLDWTGSVMLLSDADYNAYQAKHRGAPIRIVAWEDDDEACVDHVDVPGVSSLITAVDNAYKAVTSGKIDPWYVRGIHSASSIFSLITALHNVILTNDDFIGNAVEGTITGDAPNGSNWVLKTNGTITTGWFTTARIPVP